VNRVHIKNLQRKFKIPSGEFRRLLLAAMTLLKVENSELSVIYCNTSRIRKLNHSYRNMDVATDVLSFPDGDPTGEGTVYLGDIFISAETAEENARLAGVDFFGEMAQLHVHGLLHLLGYDHESDDGEMRLLQEKIIKTLDTGSIND